MRETKSNSDKGKEIISSESSQSKDMTRILFKAQAKEKLVLDSTRRFLPGGSEQGSSNYDSNYVKDKLKQMNENKENKSKKYNDLIQKGKEVYKDAKAEEEYDEYTKKQGGTKHYR